MKHTDLVREDLHLNGVRIRALHSLRVKDAETVQHAIAYVPSDWSVQSFDDYDGYLSILVEPRDNSGQPAYLISGTTKQVEMASVHGDDLYTVGRFGMVAEA